MQITLYARLGLASIIINAGLVAADLDPTNIANWPPCAQKCIPQGFSSSCKSLSDVNCICKNPDFSLSIGDCEQSTCTLSEKAQIQKLTDALCAPVGGFGTALASAVSSYYSTYTAVLPSTPVIVAPTPAPSLGNVSDLNNYPPCDIQCAHQARAAVKSCDTTQKSCVCSPEFRGMTAACVEYSCTTEEEKKVNALDDQFCGPLYVNNASLSASVAGAIASATKSAHAAISASALASISVANSTNATVTGAPSPSPFTGGAAKVSGWGSSYVAIMVMIASSLGALAVLL